MRFLHTSDWHLGKSLYHMSLLENQKDALDQIVALLVAQQVDGLIVAGDIYDRRVPPEEAVTLLDAFLHQVCVELEIPAYMIAGNHDSGERLGFGSRLLSSKGLNVAGPLIEVIEPHTLTKGDESVDIFLIPYAHPRIVANKFELESATHESALRVLLDRARDRQTDGRPSILVSHCFVAGGESSDSERTLSVGGSEQVAASLFNGFTYTALGHLHAPQNRGDAIRYSGSLLKYSFSEISHRKGVSIVEITPDGKVELEHIAISPLRDVREIEGTFSQLMTDGRTDPRSGDFLRICLTDEQSVPNAMAQLQQVYPNALELSDVARREYERSVGVEIAPVEKQTPLDAFAEFYEAVNQRPFGDAAREYMEGVIEIAQRASEVVE